MCISLNARIRSIAAAAAFLSFGIGTAMSAERVEGFFVVKEFKQGQKGVVLRGDANPAADVAVAVDRIVGRVSGLTDGTRLGELDRAGALARQILRATRRRIGSVLRR